MNKKQLKLLYEYMRWKPYYTVHSDTVVYSTILDSNVAWEVVQELQRKGDVFIFQSFLKEEFNKISSNEYLFVWGRNPDNFFRCLGEFLEQREGK